MLLDTFAALLLSCNQYARHLSHSPDVQIPLMRSLLTAQLCSVYVLLGVDDVPLLASYYLYVVLGWEIGARRAMFYWSVKLV